MDPHGPQCPPRGDHLGGKSECKKVSDRILTPQVLVQLLVKDAPGENLLESPFVTGAPGDIADLGGIQTVSDIQVTWCVLSFWGISGSF